MSGFPVTIVESGGMGVTSVESGAAPATAVESGGYPVTLMDSGGVPMVIDGGGPPYVPGEIYPFEGGVSFDGYKSTGGPQITKTWTVVSGGQVLVAGLNGTGQALNIPAVNGTTNLYRSLGANKTVGAVGFWWKQSALGTLQYFPVLLASGGTFTLGLYVNTSGAISVSRTTAIGSGTTLATSATGAIAANTLYWISLQYEISDTVGKVRVCVNGVEKINANGVDTNNGVGSVNRLYVANRSVDTAINIDDIAWYNTYTEVPQLRGYQLRPSADTAQKDLTPSTGSTNFNMVNDTTVNESTLVTGTTTGQSDLYQFGDLPVTPTAVVGMALRGYLGKVGANPRDMYLPVGSQTTVSDGSAYAQSTTASFYERFMAEHPTLTGGWTKTTVDAMRAGFKLGTGSADAQCIGLLAEVFVRP